MLLIFQAVDTAGKDGAISHILTGVNPQGCEVEILRSERIPDQRCGKKTIWKGRYSSIVDLEKHLQRNGTRVIKFFLHLSKEEQRKRLLLRIDEPDKNWKFSQDDIAERKFWKQYMRAYGDCLSATSTKPAPWYVVPADDKKNARLNISRVVIDALQDLEMSYPKITRARRSELRTIRKQLAK